MVKLQVLEEAGYGPALFGLGLSHGKTSGMDYQDFSPMLMQSVMYRLAPLDGGHNKFLESLVVWLQIKAPRYWWQQFDTYRVGVTKQSESTMHTLGKSELSQEDFAGSIPGETLGWLNALIKAGRTDEVKTLLPESFLQTRVVCTNYKALRHMYFQRRNHRLQEWQRFYTLLVRSVRFPALISEKKGESDG